MANKVIKGLTVEISGDTTKLGQALDSADKQSRALSGELRQIDKLLQFDSANPELLAQKQKVLSDQITQTADKLNLLKTAQEQAAEAFKRGEVSEEQMRALEREIISAENALQKYQAEADKTAQSVNNLSANAKPLAETVRAQKEALSELKEQYAETVAAQGRDSEEARRLAAQITALSGDLHTNEQRLSDAEHAADSLDASVETLGASEKEADKQTGAFGETLKSALVAGAGAACDALGSLVSMTGKAISAVAGAAVDFAKDSVEVGKSFDAAVSQLGATLGYTASELHDSTSEAAQNVQMLRDKAQEMGSATSFSATQAAEGLNILAMSGYSAEQSCEMIGDVLNLAAAGGLSLADAASYTSGAVKGFADASKDAQYYTDLMAKGATLANTDVKALGEALSGGSATAASYGQTADGLTLSLLRMAEQGVTGSDAANALSRAMADIYTPTDGAKKAMEALGVSAYTVSGEARDFNTVADELNKKLATMSDEEANAYKNALFSARGLQAFNKMTVTSTEKVNEWSSALSDATGSAAAQAETMLDNLQGDLTIFGSAMEGAQLVISDALSPTLREFVQIGTDGISELTAAFKDGGLTGALDAIGEIAEKAIDKVNDILPEILSTAAEIVSALSAQLPAALGTILPTLTDGLMQMLGGITAMLPDMLSVLSSVLTGIMESLAEILPDIMQSAFLAVVNLAPDLANAVTGLIGSLAGAVMDAAPVILRTLMQVSVSVITALGEALPDLLDTLLTDVLPSLITNFFAYLPDVTEALTNAVSAIADRLPDIVQGLVDYLPEIIDTVIYGITQSIPSIIAALVKVFKAVAAAIPALVKALPDVVNMLVGGIADMLPMLLDGITELVDALVSALPDIIQTLCKALPDIITAVVDALTALAPMLIDCGIRLLTALISALPEIIRTVCDALPALINGITDALLKLVPQIIQCGITLLTALVQALPDIIRQIVTVLPQIITSIVAALLDMLPMLIDCGVKLLTALVENLPEIITQIVKVLPDLIDGIISALLDALPQLIECGITLFVALVENLPAIIAGVIEAVPKIISAIVSAIEDRISAIADVGSRLIEGLWQGIKDMGAWIHDKIAGFFDGVVDGIKDFFGIESPSKLMRDQVGKNIALGVAEGIEDGENTVSDAMQDMADTVADTEITPPEIPEFDLPDYPDTPVKIPLTIEPELDGIDPEFSFDGVQRSLHMNGEQTVIMAVDPEMMEKLDQILGAVQAGKEILLDGDKLVGGTADRYNSAFGEMQVLSERSVQ